MAEADAESRFLLLNCLRLFFIPYCDGARTYRMDAGAAWLLYLFQAQRRPFNVDGDHRHAVESQTLRVVADIVALDIAACLDASFAVRHPHGATRCQT